MVVGGGFDNFIANVEAENPLESIIVSSTV